MNATPKIHRALIITRRLAVLLMLIQCLEILLERTVALDALPNHEDLAVVVTALVLGLFSLVCDRVDHLLRRRGSDDQSELGERRHLEQQQLAARDGRRYRVEWMLESQASPAIVFQPIEDLATGTVLGYEALSRFAAGRPDEWFAEAAAVGLGVELELKAIRRALASIHDLPADTYLSVNASPSTLLDLDFVETVLAVDGRRVVVELTEHVAIEDYRAIREVIITLRKHGVRLAVDDAGAGHSSLRHIAMLEPDIIKIDRSFTHALTTTAGDRSVVAALVTFGKAMGATIIAEGIEDAEGLAVARQLGVHAGQGWHIGRPEPFADKPELPRPRASLSLAAVCAPSPAVGAVNSRRAE